MTRINPLPIIAGWLAVNDVNQKPSRHDLLKWLNANAKTYNLDAIGVQIAADCLISAGIGYEQEQWATVYGAFAYANNE